MCTETVTRHDVGVTFNLLKLVGFGQLICMCRIYEQRDTIKCMMVLDVVWKKCAHLSIATAARKCESLNFEFVPSEYFDSIKKKTSSVQQNDNRKKITKLVAKNFLLLFIMR